MNIRRFIYGGVVATVGLLIAVPICGVLYGWLIGKGQLKIPGYGQHEIVAGIIAETMRGFILSYLYPRYKGTGRSYEHAVKFGIVNSLLVGTLWVVLGYSYYHSSDTDSLFLIAETIVILFQGILSGVALGLIYINPKTIQK